MRKGMVLKKDCCKSALALIGGTNFHAVQELAPAAGTGRYLRRCQLRVGYGASAMGRLHQREVLPVNRPS